MTIRFEGVRLPLPHFDLELDFAATSARLALFGPSGAGKTSLLELLTGMRHAEQGRIVIGDRVLCDVAGGVFVAPSDRAIGYAPQDDCVFPHLMVEANVAYGVHDQGGRAKAATLIDAFGLGPMRRTRAGRLSGGEKRRVAIARALAASPRLIVLDEPFAGIDLPLKEKLIDFLREQQRETGVPMIVVTHERAEALALADEVIVLERGKVVGQGGVGELLR
ncbi:MAG: ATP-binding cassette domain-containing protein [Acidobacteria bacterium]|nr:ATP-binding cassette domain-containing protein [Acidobacteriota bacterium]